MPRELMSNRGAVGSRFFFFRTRNGLKFSQKETFFRKWVFSGKNNLRGDLDSRASLRWGYEHMSRAPSNPSLLRGEVTLLGLGVLLASLNFFLPTPLPILSPYQASTIIVKFEFAYRLIFNIQMV